jgi:hypothetical protein
MKKNLLKISLFFLPVVSFCGELNQIGNIKEMSQEQKNAFDEYRIFFSATMEELSNTQEFIDMKTINEKYLINGEIKANCSSEYIFDENFLINISDESKNVISNFSEEEKAVFDRFVLKIEDMLKSILNSDDFKKINDIEIKESGKNLKIYAEIIFKK